MLKRICAIITFMLLAAGATYGDLEEVKDAIKRKGAKWKASENAITRLSRAEQERLLGVLIEDRVRQGSGKPARVPRRWDWRDAYDSTWVTPVKSQGGCGSCWAFGCIAQLESLKMIAEGTPDPELDLSEQYMVSCDEKNFGCGGGYMHPAYDFLVYSGVPPEGCFPYAARDLPCSDACDSPAMVSIQDWERVPYDADWLKAAVCEQPITVAFHVFQDFMYYDSGVYKHVWGDLLGGHAVCVVGYDNRAFICKNSWGMGWGEAGYFRIAFSQMAFKCPVRFGINAGKFSMAGAAPARYENTVTLWGNMKGAR